MTTDEKLESLRQVVLELAAAQWGAFGSDPFKGAYGHEGSEARAKRLLNWEPVEADAPFHPDSEEAQAEE